MLRFGWNATAYQLVNPGMSLWFAKARDGAVGYVCKHRTRVVAGAPVCSLERLPEVLADWEAAAGRVCYFGAAGRIRKMLQGRPGYSSVVLGAQPVWNPQEWLPERTPSLRQQFNRARNKGIVVEEWAAAKATNHPELRRVLAEWLETRGLPPLHFLVEPETLAFLEDRRVFVARQDDRPVAFLVLSPIPARRGWLTEQFPRTRAAPNGTVELLVDAAVRAVAADGSTYVTMGLVPLAENGSFAPEPNPMWLRLLARWVRAHGRRFYNFEGLEAFKAKFRPDAWEPIYAISNEPRFSFRSLAAIAAAFTQTSPLLALARGLWKALRQEWSWLVRPVTASSGASRTFRGSGSP